MQVQAGPCSLCAWLDVLTHKTGALERRLSHAMPGGVWCTCQQLSTGGQSLVVCAQGTVLLQRTSYALGRRKVRVWVPGSAS